MINKLKERFSELDPKQKKTTVIAMIIGVLVVGGYLGFESKERNLGGITIATIDKPHYIGIDPDMLEKSVVREQRAEMERKADQIEELERQMQELKERPTYLSPPPSTNKGDESAKGAALVAVPPPAGRYPIPPPPGTGTPPPPPIQKEMIGGIGNLTNPQAAIIAEAQTRAEKEDKKKAAQTVYLPPSFMTAHLLTGADVATSGGSGGSPEPLLLRIQSPAFLPNELRRDLRGCYLIAEAVGRLDKERADVRLVSLSCLSKNGRSMIDSPVKGFVTDEDSKTGLSGQVVAKFGATMARAMLAGMIKGAGEAISENSTAQVTSGITGTQTNFVDTDKTLERAFGEGVSETADMMSDFYLGLAEQTTPVIEIKSDRKVTVIISEGTELEIKPIDTWTGDES